MTMELMDEAVLKDSNSEPMPCVWLVDDDAFCREHLMRLLKIELRVERLLGFSSAVSLLAALRQKSPPDVILMDAQMPDLNGIDAIRTAKKLSPFTQVFILTTFYDLELKKMALAAGATDFLLKRNPAQIINAIQATSSKFCLQPMCRR